MVLKRVHCDPPLFPGNLPDTRFTVPLSFRSKMSVPKFEVEKFDGSNDFSLWKLKLQALLDQQGLAMALEGKDKLPESLSTEKKGDNDQST